MDNETRVIGIIASAFDLLHPGHLLALQTAKIDCNYLIAALHVDPSIERPEKNKPIQSLLERWIQLDACKYVDEIIPYGTEEELVTILQVYNIQNRYLGAEYKTKINKITGYDVCVSKAIEIRFIPRRHKFSTTELRQRIKNDS